MRPGEVMTFEKKLRLGELVLRLSVMVLGVAAAALVGSASQVRRFFSLEKRAKYTDMKILVFLVVVNGVAAGCSLLQGIWCVVGTLKAGFVFNKGLAWAIFACDQVMAYAALSMVAAAAQAAVLGQYGQPELQWMRVCNLYRKFCIRMGEGLCTAFIASIALIILSCISGFNLFRLYGSKKESRKDSNGSL